MAQHWEQAMYWANILLNRVMEYDGDGIEMYFSQGDCKVQVKQKRRQRITDFEKAMRAATPDPNSDPLRCCLPFALQNIFMESIRKPEKKHQTIFVLTDGIWEGGNEFGVESVIKSHMQRWVGPTRKWLVRFKDRCPFPSCSSSSATIPTGLSGSVTSMTTWHKMAIRTFASYPSICEPKSTIADHGD